MFLTRKTWILVALMLLLGALNLLPVGGPTDAELPALPALAPEAVDRITISQAVRDRVVLSRDEDGDWVVSAPFEAPADEAAIRRLLGRFQEPLSMDARMDEGNLEDYALDFQHGVVVELFTGGEVPAISFVVGGDTRGGSSFIRLKDEEVVYRAQVGGRYQYDRDAEDWRDRMVVQEDASAVIELALSRGEDAWRFQAVEPAAGGGWVLVEDPEFALDDRTVEALIEQLCALRAARVLPADYEGGFSPPAAVATLTFADGRQISLSLGSRSTERSAYVKRGDRALVYQVAGVLGQRLQQDLDAFRELNVLSFDRGALLSVRLVDDGVPLTISQGAPGSFAVTDPPNVDLDDRLMLGAVATLADLRADAIVDVDAVEAGFDQPRASWTLRFADGDQAVLELGAPFRDQRGRQLHFVRVLGGEHIYALRDAVLMNVLRGFGRAE